MLPQKPLKMEGYVRKLTVEWRAAALTQLCCGARFVMQMM